MIVAWNRGGFVMTDIVGQGMLAQLGGLLGDVFMLVGRLLRDEDVPARTKALAVVAGVYAVVPFDILPDKIPGVGIVDDVVILVLALDALINQTPDEVVRRNWGGSPEDLERVRSLVAKGAQIVPQSVRSKLAV
jgi:uncharacterized membrane protein YkvA (DUF1232 family)